MKIKFSKYGLQIREAIAKKGITQSEFAKEIGISFSTLSSVIHDAYNTYGYRKYGDKTLYKILRSLDIPLE